VYQEQKRSRNTDIHIVKFSFFQWLGITFHILEAVMWIVFPQIFWAALVVPVVSWNLSYFAPPHASIGQVAVWRNRAFICLPRYELGTIRATLLEAPWPESKYLTHQLTRQVKSEFTSSKH